LTHSEKIATNASTVATMTSAVTYQWRFAVTIASRCVPR
jgi:hypothetical protein